jgi:outer membrane protein TolC
MRGRRLRRPAAVLTALAMAMALALTPHANAETLEEAWSLALQHDHRVAAAAADVDAALSTERAARAARWPSVGANASVMHFAAPPQLALAAGGLALNSPLFAGDNFSTAGLQVQLPLYAGGRITQGIAAAHESARGATEAAQVETAALRLDVARSYLDVLRARRALAAAESSVASLSAHASDVGSLVERELVARSDLLAAHVALSNAEQQRVRAANAVALAVAEYNRRLGQPLDREPLLDERVPVDAALAEQPVEVLVTRARGVRGELAALAAQTRALAWQARAERGQMLPQVALTGSRTWMDNEILDRKDFSYVGLGVSWKLFDGGEARQRSNALRNASRASQSRLDDQTSLVELEVRRAWLGVREARARVAAARDGVEQAEENLRISRELYGSGLATNTQVLDAVALQVAASNNRDNATLDVSLASLTLARAVGTL